MSNLFSLKWENHITVMSELKYFLSAESMVDVTLACDGQKLKAHKIVLAACSPYFRSLFIEHPCKHPIVILKDVKYPELKAIIEFMYCGEVKVAEDNLTALMKTAETLRVRGLSQMRSNNDQADDERTVSVNNAESSNGVMYSIDLSKWTLTRKPSVGDLSDDDIDEPIIKQEPSSDDMNVSVFCSTDSSVSLHVPSTSTFHGEECIAEQNVDRSCALEESCMQNITGHTSTTENLPSQAFQSPVLSNHENDAEEEISCSPILSADSVASMHVSSDVLVSDNQPPPSDSATENLQSRLELSSEKLQNNVELKIQKRSTEMAQNLEKLESQRRSLRQLKKELHPSNLLDSSSKPVPEMSINTSSDASKDSTPKTQDAMPETDLPYISLETKKKLKKIPKKITRRPVKLQTRKANGYLTYRKVLTKNSPPREVLKYNSPRKDSSDDFSPKRDLKDNSQPKNFLEKIENTPGWKKFFRCSKCSFKTAYSTSIKRHILSKHKKLKRFKCEQCDYAAALRQHLLRHIAEVHENVTRFQCPICPYKFAQEGNMKRHVRTVHGGDKPFKCDQCDFRTAHKCHIKKHVMAVHEQKKDFVCPFCSYRCFQRGNLKRHMIGQHDFKNHP